MQFTVKVPSAEFGITGGRAVPGFKAPARRKAFARYIAVDPDYVFSEMLFNKLRLWWETADTREPLCISGPAGCGKTSGVLQFLARLNVPVVTLTCRKRMDKYELIGRWGPGKDGGLSWVDGPAALAWRYGFVLVVNEVTTAPPDVWVSMNDLLEGDDLVNDRTGEVIPRHPNARVVFTDNCGLGTNAGSSATYVGRQTQDRSVMERCWHIAVGYPDEATEIEMVAKRTRVAMEGINPAFAEVLVKDGVALARKSRIPPEKPVYGEKPVVISPRTLVRFLTIFAQAYKENTPVQECLELAFRLSIGDAIPKSKCLGNLNGAVMWAFEDILK